MRDAVSRPLVADQEVLVMRVQQYLMSVLETDRAAVEKLIWNAVPCSLELADHPHALVNTSNECPSINTLGLLNGLLLAIGLPRMYAVTEKTAHIQYFVTFPG